MDGSIRSTQSMYALELLNKCAMLSYKPCRSPTTIGSKLNLNGGALLDDPTPFRMLV